MKYRTIVADPPWDQPRAVWRNGKLVANDLDYQTMSCDEIASLQVRQLCEGDKWHVNGNRGGSHLYLWTTTLHLEDAFRIARAWRFNPTAVLVWCKPVRGFNVGGTWPSNVEFVVFGRRGSPPATIKATSRWFTWSPPRVHSQKPEAFYDLVEQVSPGPYLELFARRNRLGWDTWGNECLEHVEVAETGQP